MPAAAYSQSYRRADAASMHVRRLIHCVSAALTAHGHTVVPIHTALHACLSCKQFELFHTAIREPVDLYAWGNSFFSPLLEFENSHLQGLENLQKISEYLKAGENVFLLANHQVMACHSHFEV
jgi:hypothetical protein